MKSLCAVLTLATTICVSPWFFAADKEKGDYREGSHQAATIQDLNLTDDQEAKIAEIRKDCSPKLHQAAKELADLVKEEVEKVQGVLTPQQLAKVREMKEERREHIHKGLCATIAHLKDLDLTETETAKIAEIRKEFHPKIVNTMESMKGILTDAQQKTRMEALNAGKKRSEVLASLNLTDDQKAKMRKVCKEVGVLVKDELNKIKDVLTEEQREKLQDMRVEHMERVRDRWAHRVANFRELNLTEEQKSKISEVRKEFRPRIHEAGNKLRSAVREELQMILAVIKE